MVEMCQGKKWCALVQILKNEETWEKSYWGNRMMGIISTSFNMHLNACKLPLALHQRAVEAEQWYRASNCAPVPWCVWCFLLCRTGRGRDALRPGRLRAECCHPVGSLPPMSVHAQSRDAGGKRVRKAPNKLFSEKWNGEIHWRIYSEQKIFVPWKKKLTEMCP